MAKRDRWAEGWTKANACNATGAHSGSTAPKGPGCDASEPRLFKRPELLAMGGEEREVSVLFADVKDFSTISERLTPTGLVELLNEYLTAMTDIVLEHGSIVDKYQGDLIIAEFGVPMPLENHAAQASGDETTPSDDMLGSMGADRDQVAGIAHGPSSQCWVAIRSRNARSA